MLYSFSQIELNYKREKMSFHISRKTSILLGLLSVFIIFIAYVAYIETHNNIPQTPSTSSPTPTENPVSSTNITLVTDYSVTIPLPEIYRVNSKLGIGFGIAEIQMKFIAPTPNLQNQQPTSEANYSTTKLPITLSTKLSNTTNQTLPPIVNGTTIEIKVDVYKYTMITDNPRILEASQEWNETKYVYT
jgi:hypothetical protein